MKLYQLYSKTFKAEQFCFHAHDLNDAENKKMKWILYHNFYQIKDDYLINEVKKSQYENNIHDECVK
jgi:hypothetical protein